MQKIYLHMKRRLANDHGDMSIFTCFFVMAIVILVSFLLLYASIKITCINILGGAKMKLNNLSASIYADTYRSQRETNFSEYLSALPLLIRLPPAPPMKTAPCMILCLAGWCPAR